MSDLQWNREFALEQAGEDEELLAELLTLLMDSSADDLAKIKEGHAQQDAAKMADAAHSIKGAAASLGIEKLHQLAYAMEKAGRSADLAGASALIAPLESALAELSSLQ